MVSPMQTGLINSMIILPQVLFLYSLVLIQSFGVLQSNTVAHSSSEVEYRAIAVATAELQWVKSLMSELLVLVQSPPTLFLDNLGATYLSANRVFHSCMTHLAIGYHFVIDLIQSSELCVFHVSTGDQLVDALTKSLSWSRLFSLCNKIDVISSSPS